MGAKQTKIEGYSLEEYISEKCRNIPQEKLHEVKTYNEENLDPRSPSATVCRTPICLAKTYNYIVETPQQNIIADNPLGILRKRILRGLNLDPRSPSLDLNRTPLVFDEKDRTLNLNDTFADLFVESRAVIETTSDPTICGVTAQGEYSNHVISMKEEYQIPVGEYMKIEEFICDREDAIDGNAVMDDVENEIEKETFESILHDEDTMACTAELLPRTPPHLIIDPRSPSTGVDRTPIILNDDDDEATEEAMLENILATLSLSLSNNSSICSMATTVANEQPPIPKTGLKFTEALQQKPANKHLDRVKTGRRRSSTRNTKNTSKACSTRSSRLQQQQQRIYEDNNENTVSASVMKRNPETPKQKSQQNGEVRTPLSCVKNRPHLRSRSVENSSKKQRVLLTSYDDALNPQQSPKVSNLRIMDICF